MTDGAQPLNKLKVLVISQYFWPENFRVNDLVKELIDSGHEITVLTAKPNYPDGQFFPAFVAAPESYSSYAGEKIIRVPILPRGKGGLRLLLNYISYFVSASIIGVFKLRKQSFDVIFVFQGSPVTVGIPAVILGWLKKAPVVIWVLDLWPDTLLAVGALKPGKIYNAVGSLVSFIFNRCHFILGQSEQFLVGIQKYCKDKNKIKYFPSWAEDIFDNYKATPAVEVTALASDFNIVFAGNIGDAQNFDAILKAAEQLKSNKKIKWFIVGDGRLAGWVKDEIKKRDLTEDVYMLGRYPLERMPSFYKAADALLVSLKPDAVFAMTIPGKIQSYMKAGKPILSMLDGEGSRVIDQANAGLTCPSGAFESLAKNTVIMSLMKKEELIELGANGRTYAEKEFDRKKLLKKLEAWLYEALDGAKKLSGKGH